MLQQASEARTYATPLPASHGRRMPQTWREDATGALTALLGRSDALDQPPGHAVFWMVLRGTAEAESREGRFRLAARDWIVFDAQSGSELRTGRHGLAIALFLPESSANRTSTATGHGLFPGKGHMSAGDMRIAIGLWRACLHRQPPPVAPLLRHLQYLQRGLHVLVDRCPGRMSRRRRQVLARMQRIRLMLEGNVHRIVRLDELAALVQFSDWWVSKTFHAVYGETIQRTAIRLRMERARELLRDTTLSISEIGEMCGIQDPCSFARQFKAWHGVTASQWRLEHQTQRQKNHDEQADFSTVFSRTGT